MGIEIIFLLSLSSFKTQTVKVKREIYLQLDYIPDDKLIAMRQGNTPVVVQPDTTRVEFKGFIGDQNLMTIYNLYNQHGIGEIGIHAIFMVGTTEFSTNRPEKGWSGWNSYDPPKTQLIKGQMVNKYGGKEDGGEYQFFFTIPTDETYCSSFTPDKADTLASGNFASPKHIEIETMIYPIEGYPFSLIIKRLPTKGKLSNESTNEKLSVDQPYSSMNFSYKATNGYGFDSFDYIATSNEKNSGQCTFTIFICYSLCQTCTLSTDISPQIHNCLSCIEGYALDYYIPTNCLLKDTIHDDIYYDEDSDRYEKCDVSCKTCISEFQCITCNTDNDYYFQENVPYKCHKKDDFLDLNTDYYLDTSDEPYILRKCYVLCTKCSKRGDILHHHCDICIPNYYFHPIIQTNCCKYWFIDQQGNYICADECNYDYPFIENPNHCVSSCKNNHHLYQNMCYSNCPPNTFPVGSNCVDFCFPDQLTSPNYINYTLKRCFLSINEHILAYHGLNHHISGIEFSFQVYSDYSLVKGIPNDISQIDFSSCESILRSVYSIPSNDILIFSKYDVLTGDKLTNRVEYSVFDKNGKRLDLSLCSDVSIQVIYPIINSNESITLGEAYCNKGVDVFNASHDYFNDICYINRQLNSSYPITYRREHVYQNISLCESNCRFNLIDYLSKFVLCDCTPKAAVLPLREYITSSLQQFPSAPPLTNLVMGKCYLVFSEWNNIQFNVGFWLIGILVIANMISIIIYCAKGLRVFYHIMYSHSIKQAKLDSIENWELASYLNKFGIEDKTNTIYGKEIRNKAVQKLNCLPFFLARKFDNRSMWKMFFDICSKKVSICRLFYLQQFEVLTLKLSNILLLVIVSFTLNAILFQDDLITLKYLNSPLFYVSVFIASVISFSFTGLLSCLTQKLIYFAFIFQNIFSEFESKVAVIKQCYLTVRLIKKRVQLFNVIDFIIILMCFYYSVIFFCVYYDEQLTLIYAELLVICLSFSCQVLLALVIACCRYHSLINQSKNLYLVSFYLYNSIL